MQRKKIIRITTSDISLDSLIKGQLRYMNQYFDVIGVSNNTGALNAVGKREGIRTIEIPIRRNISLKADWICLWKLYSCFKTEKPDIVHANTPKGSLLAMIAGKLANVPHRIYTVTGLRYQGTKALFRQILMAMERITCLCATKVIPEGNGVKKALQQDRITRKPLQVILNGNINGIDTHYFSPQKTAEEEAKARNESSIFLSSTDGITAIRTSIRASLHLTDTDFAFIFIGRIVRDKGMNELAACMHRIETETPQCKLILVGNFETELDPLANGNEQFFKTASNVRFVGFQKDVRPYLLAADALVFPSYREGFPNVVMQAGAMGLPAIVTDINGCNEIIENQVNGKIIAPKNQEALYQAMMYFLQNPTIIKEMAIKARPMIQQRYEQKKVWEALLEEYRKLE